MKTWLLLYTLSRAADLGTTQAVLAQPNGYEANPMLSQRPSANLAVGVAVTTGSAVYFAQLSKSHPKIAKWLTIGATAVEVGVTAHNLQTLRH